MGQILPVLGHQEDFSIRSRHGLLRGLLPIYSAYQLLPNLLALGCIWWLIRSLGHFPTAGYLIVMLGWVFQFVSRPSVMNVSAGQAAALEAVLEAQAFYGRAESDGRWRRSGRQWWQRWPHEFIEFAPADGAADTDGVTVTAPREVMESLRATLESLERQGAVSFVSGGQPLTVEPTEPERLPWHVHVPAAVIGAICVTAWIWHLVTAGLDGMSGWGVSAKALHQGRFETIFLHMFAHGGAIHLAMNMTTLAAVGGTLTARLGPTPLNWLRFLLLYLLGGLAGAALYLAMHPAGTVPMLGASGALYGLFGLLIRVPTDDGALLAIRSSRIRRIGWDLVKQNAFLFALLAVMSWSSGTAGGLAWEAHLGGFLFGLFVGPRFLPGATSARHADPVSDTRVPAN